MKREFFNIFNFIIFFLNLFIFSYSNTIKRISTLYRDRPMSARETAAYWVEYVIRHHGAPHMQYPAVHQNFIQQNSLDVIAFLIVSIYVVLKIISFVIRYFFRALCVKLKDVKKLKKN